MKPQWRSFALLSGIFLGIVLLWAGLMGVFGFFELDESEVIMTYTFDGKDDLTVDNDMGDITVSSWDRDVIEVYLVKKTYFGDDELKKIDVKIDDENGFSIKSSRENGAGWVWMDITVHVPKNMEVAELTTDTGDISLRNAEGNATLITDTGDIKVKDIASLAKASTDTGSIRIDNVSMVWRLETDTGDVDLDDCGILLSCDADTGDIDADVESIHQNGMHISTDTGNIDVSLPLETGSDFDMRTDAGDVKVRGWEAEYSRHEDHMKIGSINGGGPKVKLITNTGDIYLRARR